MKSSRRSRRSRRALSGLFGLSNKATLLIAGGVALAAGGLAWYLLRAKRAKRDSVTAGSADSVTAALAVMKPASGATLDQKRPNFNFAKFSFVPSQEGGATSPASPSDTDAKADPCYGLTGEAGLNCRSDKAEADLRNAVQ